MQRSAAGEAYAQHEAQARVTASVLSGQTHGGMACALEDPAEAGDPGEVAALVEKDFGISATEGETSVTVEADTDDLAWAVGSWAVARADRHRRHPGRRRRPRVAPRHAGLRAGVAHRGCRPGSDATTVTIHLA